MPATSSVTPQLRLPRSTIDSEFLRIGTATGVHWHRIDETSMDGRRERFDEALSQLLSQPA
jgi:hypothetical protein